ncbi:MAG TPA: ATP-binding protein, partial [Ktedonobacterales bacterium]
GDLLLRIETQARRLDRLVSDLLDDARIQQGQLEYRWGEGDVAGAVAEAVDEQRTSHPERQIDLRVADVPLVAQLDADRIGQVVTNLLTNALKYSRAEDPVEVTVASQRHAESGQVEAVVRVRDRGPGIPTEHVAQVFERYYRVPGVEVRSGSGIGLGVGLHLACSIVERHGGRIWVDEAASPGATFAFTIPLLDPPPPAP